MKKKFLAGACLIVVVLLLSSLASVPPCDQYLEWCMFTWCPQHNYTPQNILECQTQCIVNWDQYCN